MPLTRNKRKSDSFVVRGQPKKVAKTKVKGKETSENIKLDKNPKLSVSENLLLLQKNPAKWRYDTSVSLFIKILVWGWQNPYLGP